MFKKIWGVLLGLVVVFSFVSPVEAFDDDWTIYSYLDNYQPAKFEPVKGTYLGAYLLQEKSINNDMVYFNELAGKDHMTYFKYVGYGQPFPIEWINEVIALGGIPHIAWEPNDGLIDVKDDAYLQSFADAAGAVDAPIFIRFASEMNGDWVAYSGDPALYKEKWRLVHRVMEKRAPKAMMLWSVFTFPEHTILKYYPGDEVVDWVGVNIYNVVYHNDSLKHPADKEDPLRLLDFVYDEFSSRKPIHISEYGASNYTTTDHKYYPNHAIEKINRLYKNLPTKYPRVKAITYFNVNTLSPENNIDEQRRINNYALTTDARVLEAYKKVIKNPHYLSDPVDSLAPFKEKLSFNYRYFIYKSKMHVDLDFFKNNMGLKVVQNNGQVVGLTDGQKTMTWRVRKTNKPRSFYGMQASIRGLPLREITDFFGYGLTLDYKAKTIHVINKH